MTENKTSHCFTRAMNLFSWLKTAKQIRVTTPRGTDLVCDISSVDGMYPVLGIIPFYSEVAIVPSVGSVDGVAVIDGASERTHRQRGFPIRPNLPTESELYMEPLELYFEKSRLASYCGPDVQVRRMDDLMKTVDPQPRIADEIGIVTTDSPENNAYGWKVDGSHQIHCLHVALGNNSNRKEIIHAQEHIDFDMHNPSIWVDGVKICTDGCYDDAVIAAHSPLLCGQSKCNLG